ncbi:acyl-CoA dehydrogenase family protein [Streptomyces sp. NPDC001165]|uniref:acyl-CoA dehydrogenase family protein n=1 Tax=Streptomyces sp. NPDC001165 TaxID=3364546 RepID=UPI00369CCDE2
MDHAPLDALSLTELPSLTELFESLHALERLRSEAHAYAALKVAPNTAERDRAGHWDPQLFAGLATIGLSGGALLPPSHGGHGLTALQTAALLDGYADGSQDPGTALAAIAHGLLCAAVVHRLAPETLRRRLLPALASGEQICGISLLDTLGGAVPTTATATPVDGGGAVLTGAKRLVVNAEIAHQFVVVITEHAYLVDRDTPGLTVVEGLGPAAVPTCTWGELAFEECRLGPGAVLGPAVQAVPLLAAHERVFSSAVWLGAMRSLVRHSAALAGQRRLFDAPLGHSQAVRARLADMRTRLELCVGLVHRAAALLDRPGTVPSQHTATVRLFTATAAQAVAESAAALFGPEALADGHPVHRAQRDAAFFAAAGGGPDVLQPVIAAPLLALSGAVRSPKADR